MDEHECITWLKIMRANLRTFPEISSGKKIKALDMAIKVLEQQSDKYIYYCPKCKWVDEFSFKLDTCPICGRDLEEERDEAEREDIDRGPES